MADGGLAAVADHDDEDQNWSGPAQDAFEETDYTHVRFVGAHYNSLTMDPKLGDEFTFTVRGRVTEVGDKALKDGHVQHRVALEVNQVTLPDDDLDDGA